ncbi:hypothetical protein ACFYPA_21670 [Streptomyces sp. NPDC005775]|uniref:effector-associated constant component EACC1 n=1 Tax=unclassified Streptomyces TaxID=2593676 RepID=UPI00340708C9
MHVDLRMEQGTGELRSLHVWLRNDAAVRRSSTSEVKADGPPQPGQMGSTLEVIKMVTENGWSAASFVMAVVAWKRTRPQSPQITITRDDTTISLTNCSDDEVRRVIRVLDDGQSGESRGE